MTMDNATDHQNTLIGQAEATRQLVSVIVPTYCEAENLAALVARIDRSLAEASVPYEIVVVDDNSPDATKQVCEELQREHPIRLIVRRAERGLATAVIAGMEASRGDTLVCMDADLSHPPEAIPALVNPLANSSADFVIGSRYVQGGKTDEHWGMLRWLNSKIATWLAWPLTTAKDPMAGFFALRRETFEQALPRLDPIGYKIGLELIVKSRCQSVFEIPIAFQDRTRGESKLSWREQLNYVRHLLRLYAFQFEGWTSFAKFGLVGASGVIVDIAVLSLLVYWLPIVGASAIAIWAAMTWNYFLNRRITFPNSRAKGSRQYVSFCLSCAAGAAVNLTVRVALAVTHPFFARHFLLCALAGIGAGYTLNYLLCRHFVFTRDHSQA